MTNNNEQITKINPLLVESFLRDGKKTVDILGALIEKGDFSDTENLQQFRITVHGVKSSLRNVGETGLAEVAGKLEDACRNGYIDVINTKTSPFLAGLRAVLNKMQPDESNNISGEDPPDIAEKLSELKEMCMDYNRRGALNIIAEITACTAETRAKLDAVKDLVQQSDFEEAEALL